jgi:hypothetical protein
MALFEMLDGAIYDKTPFLLPGMNENDQGSTVMESGRDHPRNSPENPRDLVTVTITKSCAQPKVYEKDQSTTKAPTKGPMWGYPRPVLGAVDPFLEPFRGRSSPNIDNVSEKLTLRYPHEGPWVAKRFPGPTL